MFDLAKEVESWSQAVFADRCRQAASVAELRDHLYSEIDRARGQGLSDEQAFAAAVAKLGPATELQAEHAKNRSLLAEGCAIAAGYEGLERKGRHREFLIAHAILWAALILGVSLVVSKSAAPESLGWVLLGLLVPGWWASDLLLRRVLRQWLRG